MHVVADLMCATPMHSLCTEYFQFALVSPFGASCVLATSMARVCHCMLIRLSTPATTRLQGLGSDHYDPTVHTC